MTSAEQIPTTLRLLFVVEEIAWAGVPVTPTDINEKLGLPKPTIHRLFNTLEEEGFLQRDLDGKTYSPGPRLRRLSGGILSSQRMRTARMLILEALSRTIGETCNIALPDRDMMTYLERVETEWPLRIQLPIGSRVPLYCTASGKMYLSTLPPTQLRHYLQATELRAHTPNTICDPTRLQSELEEIQSLGYALDHEEFMVDMVAIAVPVMDANGRLLATLSFHAPLQRMSMQRMLDHLPDLRRAAEELSQLVA